MLDRSSQLLSASRYREVAAAGRAGQAAAWPNPRLDVSAENFGQQRAFTGRDGLPGLEGQAVISPYMTYRVSRRIGLTLYGMAGLNDASPRAGGGLRISLFP